MAIAYDDDRLPALAARDVRKSFVVPEQRVHTLKERALHPMRRVRKQTFDALKGVSFAVQRGEFFAIAGRNGSGKSTLLKCIAGIYACEGDIWCRGRLSTFIELGVGFNPDLAARDNIVMNGIMMGLTPREARKRYDSVMEFAELEEFKDLKLKNYSSGMHVRLAFSVAIQVDADILLLDEILAVGDAAFQQKCYDVFRRLKEEGKTIVFVTHDMDALNRFCDRGLLLERGSPVLIGDTRDISDRYLELSLANEKGAAARAKPDGRASILDVWLEDESGSRQPLVSQGQRITVRALVNCRAEVDDPQVSMYLLDNDRRSMLVASTVSEGVHVGHVGAGDQVLFSFSFDNVLGPGRYNPVLDLVQIHPGERIEVIDHFHDAFSFLVTGRKALGGAVDLPVEVAADRVDSTVADRISV
jgi:ABC-type polysaccharide/polyol phosphate transport system ATPase subunit